MWGLVSIYTLSLKPKNAEGKYTVIEEGKEINADSKISTKI
jgi:hypothetical protein